MTDEANESRAEEKQKRLTGRQKRFIEAYLTTWNATAAAKEAGYSEHTAHSIGAENLRKPEIAREIKTRLEANHMTAEEALSRLAEMARGTIEDFVEGGAINLAKSPHRLHLIKSISEGKYGLRIEIQDQQAALEKILRAAGRLEAQDAKPVIDLNLYINDVLEKIHGERIDDQG